MQASAGVSPYLAQNIKYFKAIGGFDSMLEYLRQAPPAASLTMTRVYTKLLCKVYIYMLSMFSCLFQDIYTAHLMCVARSLMLSGLLKSRLDMEVGGNSVSPARFPSGRVSFSLPLFFSRSRSGPC